MIALHGALRRGVLCYVVDLFAYEGDKPLRGCTRRQNRHERASSRQEGRAARRHGHPDVGRASEGHREASMSRVVVAAEIVGLLLFVEPPLDGLAGYLLFEEGHRIIGTIVVSVNAVIAAGVLFSFLPEWFHPRGLMLAAAIAHYNVNVWLGLVALVYAVAVDAWPPALVLLVGAVLVAIGGRGVVAWLSSGRSRL